MQIVLARFVVAQALAAVAARLRLDELSVEGDPAVRTQRERVIDIVVGRRG